VKTLKYGAVIEREFSYDLLKQGMRVSEQEQRTNMEIPKDAELLNERGRYTESI